MAYAVYDNNGIGDVTANGRSIVGSDPFSWMHSNMEAQIHQLEQEAYCAVLRAFKAQSDAISWEKESLITELRKELRVSDDEHRELLTKVNGDDIIRRIRDWRQAGGNNTARISTSQHDLLPSPGVTTSRKKQRTSQSGHSFPGVPAMKSMHYPSAVPGRPFNRNTSGNFSATNPPEAAAADQLIGRKVWTRWPEDNSFYKAVITEYNASEGRHLLVYDMDTANETWEWVDLKEISPDDIRWDGDDLGASQRWNHGRGQERFGRTTSAPGIGRGRGSLKGGHFGRENLPARNGIAKNISDDIELLNTETLVKEVEKVFDSSHPDIFELEKAKKKLKEHEQALIDAIARLADASDGESDGQQPFAHGQ